MMFHFGRSGHDTDQRRSIRIIFVAAFGTLLIGGLLALLMMNVSAGNRTEAIILAGLTVLFTALTISVGFLFSNSRKTTRTLEKQKRAAEGMDMYSLIDRMIEDLDEDEITYLQRQLDQRTGAEKQKLQTSLGDLLNQRAEKRLRE